MQTLQKPTLKSQKFSPHEAVETLLDCLSEVQEYGNGYKALCPAHADRNPSLSIKTGFKGILLKCWAGCSLSEICRAIGLSESDLFFDDSRDRSFKNIGTVHEKVNFNYRWNWRRQIHEILNITEVRAALSEDFLEQLKDIDADSITDDLRDSLLEKISLAWAWLRLADALGEACFDMTHVLREQEGMLHG